MERFTRQGLANNAKDEYDKVYGITKGEHKERTDRLRIYNELCELGDNPNPDDVDRVIDNRYWTHVYCDECGEEADSGFTLGQPEDYDSRTATICDACIRKAMDILNSENKQST